MAEENSIEEIFLKFLNQFKYDEETLDYSLVAKHANILQTLSDIGNSGTGVFDFCKREIIFYSSNYGGLLGYKRSDYEDIGQQFFAQRIHPDDALKLSSNGITILKLLGKFSNDEKLNYKHVYEYRIRNAQNKYVRLIEQYQVLELDAKGQPWLMLTMQDLSPSQDETEGCKCQMLNFRTGQIIPIEAPTKVELELTKRELEILKFVKEGFLSKEISDKLSISVHTVNTHRQRFLEKLGANNSLEAVIFASKFGLLD